MRRPKFIEKHGGMPSGRLGRIIAFVMERETAAINRDAVALLDLGRRECVLDVGTGHGASLQYLAMRSDEKYTKIACRGDTGKQSEALIRMPLKKLMTQLDVAQFVQVHSSVAVNLRAISQIKRFPNETAQIHLKGRDEVLLASRTYLHLFHQM